MDRLRILLACIFGLFFSSLLNATVLTHFHFTADSSITPTDLPIGGIQSGTDFTGNPSLMFTKNGISFTVDSVLTNCKPYQDVTPERGGLGVDGGCGSDNLDKGESLRIRFSEEVIISRVYFYRDHQFVGNADALQVTIDGKAAETVWLAEAHNNANKTFTGTEFIFANPANNPVIPGYYVAGFDVETTTTIVNLGDCSGDVGCTIINKYGITTKIANAPNVQGKVSVRAPLKALDPRPHCTDPTKPASNLLLSTIFPNLISSSNDVIVPKHLCGIPAMQANGTYAPEVWILNIDSDLILKEEMILQEVDDTPFAPYLCASTAGDLSARFKHPVMTWIPKPGTSEIPIIDSTGARSHTVRAINIGCGSLRAGVGQFSFFPYHLRYQEGTDFIDVITDEVNQLGATVKLAEACMNSNGVQTSTLSSMVNSIAKGLAAGRYTNTVERNLVKMLEAIDGSRLRNELANCYWDNATDTVKGQNPNGVYLSRNFPGDMRAQVLHLQYMMDAMVLVREQTPQN